MHVLNAYHIRCNTVYESFTGVFLWFQYGQVHFFYLTLQNNQEITKSFLWLFIFFQNNDINCYTKYIFFRKKNRSQLLMGNQHGISFVTMKTKVVLFFYIICLPSIYLHPHFSLHS